MTSKKSETLVSLEKEITCDIDPKKISLLMRNDSENPRTRKVYLFFFIFVTKFLNLLYLKVIIVM